MTQSFPTSAEAIFDVLAADSALTAKLGEYTFKSGQTQLALSVNTPGRNLPMLAKTTGIEVVVHDIGDVVDTAYISGEVSLDTVWPVFVICWDEASGRDMHDVVRLICGHFLGSRSLQTVAASDGIGALVQTKIYVRSDKPILA